ncbi:MAG: dUTP diphosphatase [Ignavibacteriae bacterium]|nr:MAG: dUTP diphosphatase [Ignavibacteriota bacterium]
MELKIKKIDTNLNHPLPFYATENSAGLDIASASLEDIILEPLQTKLIPTNLIFEIPHGYEGQVRPRSGLAIKHNIGIINSPGTIDSDYRGELKVLLTNFGKESFTIKFGDRIAQMVISKVEHVKITESQSLSETKRASGGFGHTGINE